MLIFNLTSTALLAIGLWKLRRKLNTTTQTQVDTPDTRQLIRVRRRRRQMADQVV